MGRRLALGVLALGVTLAGPGGAELPELAPRGRGAPAGLEELEGRGPGPPGSAALLLGAGAIPLRFATPAGGSARLVVYLAALPSRGAGARESVALEALLGVPGEVRLDARGARPRAAAPLPAEPGPEPVPEPSALVLGLGGLLLLGRLARGRGPCHPARRWSGPPPG
jgi:hypothetical protein